MAALQDDVRPGGTVAPLDPEKGQFLTLELFVDAGRRAWIRGEHLDAVTVTPLAQLVSDAKRMVEHGVEAASRGLS